MPILLINGETIGSQPKIAVSIMATTLEELKIKIKEMDESEVDIIEWRIDYYLETSLIDALEVIKEATNKLVVATFRTKAEGGNREITKNEYEQIIKELIISELVPIVDIELSVGEEVIQRLKQLALTHGIKLIYSYHNFAETPFSEKLLTTLRQMEALGADLTKIAVMPKNTDDVLSLMDVTNKWNKVARVPLITISMGDLGKISRLATPLFGSAITFAAIGEASAPGQIEIKKLKELLNTIFD